MNKRKWRFSLILFLFLFSIFNSYSLSQESQDWWDTTWSYRHEIIVPTEIMNGASGFQPIDINILFNNPCWAENETVHSVRVVRQNKKQIQELESQIHQLKYQGQSIITSCNIIFLLPKDITPNDAIYIYYDGSRTPQPSYVDHVSIRDSSYYYEPISGFPLSSTFYHIIQDDISVYAISQQGRFMDYHTAQSITRLAPGTKTVSPSSGQVVASFDYSFFYGDRLDESHTTSQHLVSKQINVDGNLMVSCTIKSTSDTDDMFTTVNYMYYYCPGEEKRIYVHVTHEINNSYTISDNVLTDGIYTTLFISSVRSTAFKELNFGRIPGYIHFINEQKEFKEYPLDPNPPYISTGECIPVIKTNHDQDLSEDDGWVCFDDGRTGEAHAVIFNTTQVIRSGEDERDGIQIKAYELDSPHLPGLENNMAVILLGRNSYERGEELDTRTPKDFIVSFQAVFLSTPTGGYEQVMEEAKNYHAFKDLRNQKSDSQLMGDEEDPAYSLTVSVHNTYTIPNAQVFNLLTGLNLPFVQVELYKENQLIRSASPSRIHIYSSREKTGSNNPTILQLYRSIDWSNSSVFKSVVFTDLKEDEYIIKVFRYRPFSNTPPQFIGVQSIHIDDSVKTHIICTRQGAIEIEIMDQYGQPIPSVDVQILTDTRPISMNSTDTTGRTRVHLPIYPFQSLTLKVIDKGVLITNETVRPRDLLGLRPLSKKITIERYDLTLDFKDTWGIAPAITPYPSLKSIGQKSPHSFQIERVSQGTYRYHDLPKATYLLIPHGTINEERIELDTDKNLTYTITDTYIVNYTLFNRRGIQIEKAQATIQRGDIFQSYELQGPSGILTLPSGYYSLVLKDGGDVIGVRYIQVYSDTYIDVVTIVDPLPLTITSFIILLILSITALSFIKNRSIGYLFIGLLVCLILLASTTPWWMIQGHTNDLNVRTSLYSVPPTLVTMYKDETIRTGELAGLPPMLPIVLTIFLTIVLIGSIVEILCHYLSNKRKMMSSKQSLLLFFIPIFITFGFIGATSSLFLLSEVTTGGFIGEGLIEMTIPGEITSHMIQNFWGPDIGWFALLGIVLIVWIKRVSEYRNIRRTTIKI
ncbi:MAG: hypothetical protein QCH96_02280 [Candidatus Thermoplasmatota archaeon]|nr:hypothetical protein [Candidatus Thermoplasmatota archaeon]